MRILPIALSVLMIFTPAYSAYASMLPTKGQVVQMGKKGGALVKTGAGVAVKVGKVGRALTPVGVMGWCFANKKKCEDYADDAYEIICDLTSCDVEHKEEDEDPVDNCNFLYGYELSYNSTRTTKPISQLYLPAWGGLYRTLEQAENPVKREAKQRDAEIKIRDLDLGSRTSQSALKQYCRTLPVGYAQPIDYMSNQSYDLIKNGDRISNQVIIKFRYLVKYADDDQKNQSKRLTNDELNSLAKKIADQMDDDDIINYYNTDYDDITINNYHYYGDDIDRETNIDNQCQNNSCNEISKEIEKDIQNKKYDIDDVTPANCTIEESTGKYIACNMTIKNDEEENNTNKEGDTTNKDTNVTKKEDEEEPHFCKTSDLTKEACEFFDWVDDEPSEKQDKKVNIEDEEEEKLNKNRINLDEGCPPDQHISVSMPWGYSTTIEFTYKPYCDFARDLKPYMTATGAIVSMYIVGSCGRRL